MQFSLLIWPNSLLDDRSRIQQDVSAPPNNKPNFRFHIEFVLSLLLILSILHTLVCFYFIRLQHLDDVSQDLNDHVEVIVVLLLS